MLWFELRENISGSYGDIKKITYSDFYYYQKITRVNLSEPLITAIQVMDTAYISAVRNTKG